MTSLNNLVKVIFFLLFFTSPFLGCQIIKNLDILPSKQRGVYHTVQKGQTLHSIARTYDINVDRLKRINGIFNPLRLQVGVRLWIPEARQVLEINSKKNQKTLSKKRGAKRGKWENKVKLNEDTKAVKGFFIWPVQGQLTSKFGNRNGRHHDGIDIGARKGTPIVSAADGKVMFSGWGPTGYGLMVIIKHKNNLTTVYAHNSHNHVHKNQVVKQRQKIASVGSTGRSTGPHLHFEVRNNSHAYNPLQYLPKQ
jgi:murein DD-endopeptidase MepM/ murein hydrolase activator NlpD